MFEKVISFIFTKMNNFETTIRVCIFLDNLKILSFDDRPHTKGMASLAFPFTFGALGFDRKQCCREGWSTGISYWGVL